MSTTSPQIHDIAVIGAGAAGVMAALRGVLNNDSVLLFTGNAKDKKRSRTMWVRKIENMPGYHQYARGIEDPNRDTIKWINESEFKDNLTLLKNTSVTQIEKKGDLSFEITDHKGDVHQVKQVILTTGVMDVQPQIEGAISTIYPYANAQTVDYCIRCDGHHVKDKETVIIGNGASAGWVAVLLVERYAPPNMTILTDGKEPDFDQDLQKLIDLYHIDVITNPIDGIKGDTKKGVLEGFLFCDGRIVPADFAFIALGMLIYNELATKVGADVDDRGFVLTDEKGESSIPGLFVAGDLRANAKKQVYTAWDHAVDSADTINNRLRRLKREKLLEKHS
jgi:thioredoxin reductase (NADPH)